MASLIDQRMLFQSPYLDWLQTILRVLVADYHVESHTHALRFLLSGVAKRGKTPVTDLAMFS